MERIAPWKPRGYEKLTVSSTALTFAAIPGNAVYALIRVETDSIRWRDDGTDPTAANGMLLSAGETMTYDGPLSALKMIRVTTDATVHVSYYTYG